MLINVIIGAPCSGKSTHVTESKSTNDVVIDYDKIAMAIGAEESHGSSGAVRSIALSMRYSGIQKCLKTDEGAAWIIHTNPSKDFIAQYKENNAVFTVMDTSEEVCLQRAKDDNRPDGTEQAIKDWYESPPVLDDEDKNSMNKVVPIVSGKTASWYRIKAAVNNEPPTILIYDEIGYWGVTAEDFVNDINSLDVDAFDLRINSPGGSVFEGMAIYNAIRRHKAKVTTYIDGLAASMGSVIALAGDTVKMAENAYYMIHNPWGGCYGEAKDMRKYADQLDTMKEQLANIYQAKTGLDREIILTSMDNETWYTGKDAADNGYIDELTETLDIAACYQGTEAVSKLKHSPIKITKAAVQEQPQPVRNTRLIAAKLDLLKLTDNL